MRTRSKKPYAVKKLIKHAREMASERGHNLSNFEPCRYPVKREYAHWIRARCKNPKCYSMAYIAWNDDGGKPFIYDRHIFIECPKRYL